MRTRTKSPKQASHTPSGKRKGASAIPALTPVPLSLPPVLQRQVAAPEEDKVQRKAVGEEEVSVQRKAEDVPVGAVDDPMEKEAEETAQRIQRAPAEAAGASGGIREEPEKKEIATLRRASQGSGGASTLSRSTLSSIGAGAPLNHSVRRFMEPRFANADFSTVRVHENSAAQDAAQSIRAKAFTLGNDVYLGAGSSQSDTSLMAHELTHVVQQGGGGEQAQALRRASTQEKEPEKASPVVRRVEGSATAVAEDEGETSTAVEGGPMPPTPPGPIKIPQLTIPKFKKEGATRSAMYAENVKRPANYNRGKTKQVSKWKKYVKAGATTALLKEKAAKSIGQTAAQVPDSKVFVFETPAGVVVGTSTQVANELRVPKWDKAGKVLESPLHYQVDHIKELQVGGKDAIDNLELLRSDINMASGRQIKDSIIDAIREYKNDDPSLPSVSEVKKQYDVEFAATASDGSSVATENDFWEKEKVRDGQHVENHVSAADPAALGGEGSVFIYPTGSSSGTPMIFSWSGPGTKFTAAEQNWMLPLRVTSKEFETSEAAVGGSSMGRLQFELPADDPNWVSDEPQLEAPVKRLEGARYAGYVAMSTIQGGMSKWRSRHMSPIEVEEFGVGAEGLFARGSILPDMEILEGGIDFELSAGDFRVFKEFDTGSFKMPPPLEVTGSNLILSMSTADGLGVEGKVDFKIAGAGEGYLQGTVSTGGGLGFEGGFDFDSQLFSKSEVSVGYRRAADADKGEFYFQGELGIESGKLPGLKSAELTVGYDQATGITASGKGEVDFPGVQGGDFQLGYQAGQGMELTAGLDLSPDIPRISNGRVEVTVRKEGEQWSVGAGGKATLDLPGFPVDVKASYLAGIFDLSATVPYEKGMLSGSLTAGVTNQGVGEEGEPSGAAVDGMSIYGSGSMTVQIAPWLQATAGVTILADGNLKVAGEIGLPSAIDLFPRKEIAKELFKTPPIDIPIFGASVAGTRVGIFATISGGMRASAGIGPGQLQELKGGIEYEPANEANTRLYASGKFVVPVDAGLTLYVRGGIGAGLAIVSVTGGLEAAGTLGVEGAMEMGAQVDWRPSTGLAFQGNADIWAQPKLTFDLNAYVNAEASLLFTTITLYENSWNLASVDIGSDYRVGIHFPVDYKEGESFDVSLDDVQFTYPQIDVMNTIKGLIA